MNQTSKQCQFCQYYHGQNYEGTVFVCAVHPTGRENCPDFLEKLPKISQIRLENSSISDWEIVLVFSYYYLSNLLATFLVSLILKDFLKLKAFLDKIFEEMIMGSLNLKTIESNFLILLVSSLLGMGLILLLEKKIDGMERKIRGRKSDLILWGSLLGLGSGVILATFM